MLPGGRALDPWPVRGFSPGLVVRPRSVVLRAMPASCPALIAPAPICQFRPAPPVLRAAG